MTLVTKRSGGSHWTNLVSGKFLFPVLSLQITYPFLGILIVNLRTNIQVPTSLNESVIQSCITGDVKPSMPFRLAIFYSLDQKKNLVGAKCNICLNPCGHILL